MRAILCAMLCACSLVGGASASRASQLDAPNASPPATALQPNQRIEFVKPPSKAIHEGYVTLRWTPVDQAERYELLSGSQRFYHGRLPQGFVSGLDDGPHEFYVVAWNGADEVVGQSDPVVVLVQHWPLSMALGLLAVGAIVMIALVAVITVGTLRTRSPKVAVECGSGVRAETRTESTLSTPTDEDMT